MPYKFQEKKMLIPSEPGKDRRRKLTEKEKLEIFELYGTISQRKLAKMFGVSRRTIIFIGNPEKMEENYRRRVENGGSKMYYNKEKHRQYMKKHRTHKQELFLKGDLIENKKGV